MAFRLQSAIAGFATRSSERLKALEEDTKELAKTEAGRIAQEIAEGRKQRIADTLDYNTRARKLKSSYGLNDAQVYTIMQGGLEEADAFMDTVRAGAIEAKTKGEDITGDWARNYAANLFTIKDYEGIEAPTIAQQGEAFAAMRTPTSADSLLEEAAKRAGTTTKTLMGSASPEYLKGLIKQQVSAQAGDLTAYQGPAFGSGLPEGAGFTRSAVTPEEMLGIRESEARIAQLGAQTAQTEAQTEDIIFFRDLKGEKLTEEIANIASRTGLNTANETRLYALTSLEAQEKEAGINLTNKQVEQIAKNMQFTDAKIGQIAVENKYTEAQQDMLKAKMDQVLVQTDILGVELENAPEMAAAALAKITSEVDFTISRRQEIEQRTSEMPERFALERDQILANIGLTEARTTTETAQAGLVGFKADALQQEIFLNEQFGFKDRQAALDLVEAKIIDTERFGDFESYATALMVRNDELRQTLRGETNQNVRAEIAAEIAANEERAVAATKMYGSMKATTKGTTGSSYFTKSLNEVTTFNSLQAKAAKSLDLDLEYGDMGSIIGSLDTNKMPQFFKATKMAIDQFNSNYGTILSAEGVPTVIDARGASHVQSESIQLNAAIKNFANKNIERATADEAIPTDTSRGRSVAAQVVAEQDAATGERKSTHRGMLSTENALNVDQAEKLANALENLVEGDTAQYQDSRTGRMIYMVYSGGEWINPQITLDAG
ncbi:hypothetical protein [Hyphomonas sp.]|uniref:hypothetical protein n=1 Tax=Hyphomonas sp. TaxID=87 RepID=UPI000C8BEA21|nr:hypothetical protein [Hyphomonas sp.]MAL44469.1 hypothetical protein [Hyphomonas sp.]